MDSSKSNYIMQIEKRLAYFSVIFQRGLQSLLIYLASQCESVYLHTRWSLLLAQRCKPNSSIAASAILLDCRNKGPRD